jgi:putative glycosyltransferase (TIGR04372 family)
MSLINLPKSMDIIYFKFVSKIRQIIKFFVSIVFTVLCLPFAILIRLVKPIIHIRIVCLRNDVIGNSVMNAEYYLCQKKQEFHRTFDFFYLQDTFSTLNKHWTKMLKKKFKPFPFLRYLDNANSLLYNSNDYKIGFSGRDLKGLFYHSKKNFSFNEKENNRGKDFLRSIGLNFENQKFICLNIRDEAYKKKFQSHKYMDDSYWNYHNFRNSNIENYEETVLKLLNRGYWVIRMGKSVEKKMNIVHDQFLDYANSNYQEDFLDIWLMANCFFTISGDTGLDEICKIFRKPIVHLNYAYFHEPVLATHAQTSFKLLRYKNSKKFINLREIINKNIIEFHRSEHFEDSNIELIENEPNEISEAVFEMENKLQNNWTYTKQDILLQRKFFNIFKSWKNYSKFFDFIHPKSEISSTFLRKHCNWFLQ